jgi:transitional endoplasmic reticulum ATPase
MEGVVVIGATNKPDMLDAALLRPGRFDRLLLTPAPDEGSRFKIFKIHTRNMPIKVTAAESREISREFEHARIDLEKQKMEIIMQSTKGGSVYQSNWNQHDENEKKPTGKIKDFSDKDKLLYLLSLNTEGYSGADIEGLCREAAMLALRGDIASSVVTKKHFEEAMKEIAPTITKDLIQHYERLKETRTSDIYKTDKKDTDVV